MSQQSIRGISRQGLNTEFEKEEAKKSNSLLQAALLRDQGQEEAAVSLFAQAASIEERLSALTLERGLQEKSIVHQVSAAGCWAQAGNFYEAIEIYNRLLNRDDLPERLRQRVQSYAQTLRTRRAQWYAELTTANAGGEN